MVGLVGGGERSFGRKGEKENRRATSEAAPETEAEICKTSQQTKAAMQDESTWSEGRVENEREWERKSEREEESERERGGGAEMDQQEAPS